ncbi:hypothetical protein Tco_0287607 [Tanacetum coccineum]
MGELTFFLGLQVKQQSDGIFISQDKSMIGSLMYLTALRPYIMFDVCACARFQVTPKALHLNAVKRIFRYLKHQSKLGLWYPRDSPFALEAYSDSDYRGASLDRKSTTESYDGLCFNFMNTKIHIDNESTISVIKNPVAHSRTKHIEIRFHFIRDCYEKRLIEVIKSTDQILVTFTPKGFEVTRRISMDWRMDRSCAANSTHIWSVSTNLATATVRTLANGTQQLLASIDSKEYTITEASVRSKLQLADATGIHNLSDTEIYAGLATLGGYAGDIVPLLPAILAGAAMDQGEGSITQQAAEPHPTQVLYSLPSTSYTQQSPPHSPFQSNNPHSPHQSPPSVSPFQITHNYSPPHSSPPRSYEAPLPEGNTSGSAEASIQLKELMVLVPSLVTRVTSLEKELKDTKQTLGNVVLKLVKKVKSLEKALKRKSKKVIMSASEGEEPEDQGRIIQDIDDDPLVSLVRESMKEKSTDFVTPTKASGEAQEEEISPTILEAAKTLSKVASQSVSKVKSTDKGKRYKRARSMAKKD